MLSRYSLTFQRNVAPPTWVVDLFLDLSVPPEAVLAVLESLFFSGEPPFQGRTRRFVANDIVYVTRRWFEESARRGGIVFGGEDNIVAVAETLRSVLSAGVLDDHVAEEARILRMRIEQVLR
jgi:nuclear pore complex protein Nup155